MDQVIHISFDEYKNLRTKLAKAREIAHKIHHAPWCLAIHMHGGDALVVKPEDCDCPRGELLALLEES